MKCLRKFVWVKIPRAEIPRNSKGMMLYFLRLAFRAAFRKGTAMYCGHKNEVDAGCWVGGVVCLTIPEPLPGLKELTGTVEDHWSRMIHEAIAQQSKNGIPYFDKAHVHIRITTPHGSHNHRLWDTSNRAINVIINNLKGIFFDDDDFEHMSFSVEAGWGEMGMTEIRCCDYEELKKGDMFR